MKKIIFLIPFLISFITFGQSGWFWQNPLPQGNYLNNIQFINETTGFSLNSNNLLRTTNGGNNWILTYPTSSGINRNIFMIDNLNGYITLDSTTVMRTTDGGLNWTTVSSIPSRLNLLLYFLDINTGFIVEGNSYDTGNKLYRTTDKGASWNLVIRDSVLDINTVNFTNSLTGFATGDEYSGYGGEYHLKIFKTTNGGARWDSIQNSVKMEAVSSTFINENTGFVGGRYNGNGRLYKTTNGGYNWNNIQTFSSSLIAEIKFLNSTTGFVLCDYEKFGKTTNAGDTWITYSLTNSLGYNNLYHISFLNSNMGYGCGERGILAKTSNGGENWLKQNTSITEKTVWDINFNDNLTGFAAGDGGTILTTYNGGNNWVLTQLSPFYALAPITTYNKTWYVTESFYGKIFRSNNSGLSWDTLYPNVYAITRLKFVNEQTGFGVCKYNSFIKTTDGGLNWLVQNVLNYGQNWSMDFIDENTGFAGGSRTYKTIDGGNSWNAINFGFSLYSSDIQFIDQNTGYIGGNTSNGVLLKTTDAGQSWSTHNFPTNYVNDIFFYNDKLGFVLTGGNIYKTTDGGDSFLLKRTCTSGGLITICFSDSLTGYGVGSDGIIIKTTTGGESVNITPINNVPSKFYLYQNYPNPFNPVTKIKFDLPKQAIAKLVIYDILGRVVEVLINEELLPNTYIANWNGANYASGVYFIRLETSEYSQTRKMVLVK